MPAPKLSEIRNTEALKRFAKNPTLASKVYAKVANMSRQAEVNTDNIPDNTYLGSGADYQGGVADTIKSNLPLVAAGVAVAAIVGFIIYRRR